MTMKTCKFISARDVNKDSSLKAKARTKDSGFVLKNNQGPRTKDNIPDFCCA